LISLSSRELSAIEGSREVEIEAALEILPAGSCPGVIRRGRFGAQEGPDVSSLSLLASVDRREFPARWWGLMDSVLHGGGQRL